MSLSNHVAQAVISFTFAGDEFIINCRLEGIKENSLLFNALEAHHFIPVYDLNHGCYEMVTPEYLEAVMPNYLRPQAC